jgi:predicted RNA-binding protein YlxR (DUF448 family)/ribosomal protein L30E
MTQPPDGAVMTTDETVPDGEDEAEEQGPLRRCLVTGDRLPREAMIRFAVAPDGALVPDVAAILPGRGLWLTARREVVETAVKKRAFDRAARRGVTVPPDLADRIEALLAKRCGEAIGLARRAGTAVAGFEKVSSALKAGRVGLVLAAADGAEDGRRKIAGLAQGKPVFDWLSSAELAAAFGREHAVHGGVGPGPLARRLLIDGKRLAGFRRMVDGNKE